VAGITANTQQKKTNEKGSVKINRKESHCREYHKAKNRFLTNHRLYLIKLKEKPKKGRKKVKEKS
jgi:hypothetical protein